MKRILDMTCGGRSIWFNKNHPDALYFDCRKEEHEKAFGANNSTRHCVVCPDIEGDYRALPFDDETFSLVVFDPPHIIQQTDKAWITKLYGRFSTKEEALESVRGGSARA